MHFIICISPRLNGLKSRTFMRARERERAYNENKHYDELNLRTSI